MPNLAISLPLISILAKIPPPINPPSLAKYKIVFPLLVVAIDGLILLPVSDQADNNGVNIIKINNFFIK